MKICLVSSGTLKAFKERDEGISSSCLDVAEEGRTDLICFGFNGIGEVSYEKELKGESRFFEDAAALSKETGSVVVCGCLTDSRGLKRKSALVAENGRLAGISDMLYVVDGEVSCGAALRVYETKIGKMGIAVAEDLHFPDVVKSLALCGSDFIVCPFGCMRDEMQGVLLRAYAYTYGVPIVCCGQGYAMIVDGNGKMTFAASWSPAVIEFENRREYHLLQTRRRLMRD